jgi:hypothetical protein
MAAEDEARIVADILHEVADEAAPGRNLAGAYQDFQLRCRTRGMSRALDMAQFHRRFAMAQAGIEEAEGWEEAMALAATLPEEMFAPSLAIARAARLGADAPTDAALARLYGTSSPGRARWMLSVMEERKAIVSRIDLGGRRSISLPHFGWQTAPAAADPARPGRLARISDREAARGRQEG